MYIRKFAVNWLSRHILNFIPLTSKEVFRKIENENTKLVNQEEHLNFNLIYNYIYIIRLRIYTLRVSIYMV